MMMVVVLGFIDELVEGVSSLLTWKKRFLDFFFSFGGEWGGPRCFSVWKGQADARADPPLIIRWLFLSFLPP